MNSWKLWRAFCATTLCVALLCGMAVAEGDIALEIDAANVAEEDVTVELDEDLDATVEDTANLNLDLSLDDGLALIENAPEAIDGAPVALTNEGEESKTNVPLEVTYSGPALTKEYDLTRNVFKKTSSGGYTYLVTPPKAADFKIAPVKGSSWIDGHMDVEINIASIKSVEQFSAANVGSYNLKFTFGLKGNDAQYYTAQAVTIPATITARSVEITPRTGLSKVYGTKDPAYPEGSWLSSDETSPLHQNLSGVPVYGLPVNTKDGKLTLTVTNQAYLLEEAKLKGTRFFPNDGWLDREPGEDVGKYKITIGKMDFGSNFKTTLKDEVFTITAKNIADDNITVDAIPDQTYTGKPIEPALTVRYGTMTLKKGTDFIVTYENNTEPGMAKVTLKGKGNYTGTKKISFKVGYNLNPKGTYLTKVKGGRKQIQVKWKKNKKVTGYQIAYSLTRDFAIWEDVIVRNPKKTSVTIKGLKSKKTYYIRIRTYKRLNGRRHWSPWSDYMKVKTK